MSETTHGTQTLAQTMSLGSDLLGEEARQVLTAANLAGSYGEEGFVSWSRDGRR